MVFTFVMFINLVSFTLTDRLSLDHALLLVVSADPVVVITEVCTLHVAQEVLVVGDDNELEVGLCLSGFDNVVK
jgi:hypothetical protein